MTYQIIENFISGQDTRKSPLTSAAGTLTRLINAVITPGGEIAKRRAFINVATVSGTFGMAATESSIYVFGRNVDPTLPSFPVPGVTLKGGKIPNGDSTLQQTDFDVFDGQVYLACRTGTGPLQEDPLPTAAQNPHYYLKPRVPLTAIYDGLLTEGAAKGYYVRTFQSKIYSVLGKLLSYSAIGDPMIWTPPVLLLSDGASLSSGVREVSAAEPRAVGTGAGWNNVSLIDADSERLKSLEVYYDKLAVFSSEATQIWAVDADPLQNAFEQLLRGSGTTAPRSPLQYGSGDVLYLDPSGVRSLKAKDSSNSASVSDIGSPIDPAIRGIRLDPTKGDPNYADRAISLLEPSVGRFWMIFPKEILVLSYFPGPKITAWSTLTLPELAGATISHAVSCGSKIFLRDSADKIWVYGGTDGLAYNNCGVEVRLPYLDGKKPGHKKTFQAFDATVNHNDETITTWGSWRVAVSYDFNNPNAEEAIATISQPTWNAGAGEMQGYDSHFSLRFYNDDTLPASISNCAAHYNMADEEA